MESPFSKIAGNNVCSNAVDVDAVNAVKWIFSLH